MPRAAAEASSDRGCAASFRWLAARRIVRTHSLAAERAGRRVMVHFGSCFCGAVELEVTGSPEAMGYCHCGSCRSWSGAPVNAFSLWRPQDVQIVSGAAHVASFENTEHSQRQYCAKCG